jgi:hypothetical protein
LKLQSKLGTVSLSVVAGFCLLWIYLVPGLNPPEEKELVANFHTHRASYERLREMIREDSEVEAVYTRWGVETTTSGLPRIPPAVNFPASRWHEYLAVLKQMGARLPFASGRSNRQWFV